MLGLKYLKSGLSVVGVKRVFFREWSVFEFATFFFVLWFIFFKIILITSHKLDGIYGVRGRGVEYRSRKCWERKILWVRRW